mgnify:CR=1 FL=1
MATMFTKVYNRFLGKITDDMYMELTELDTFRMLEELLMSAIHKFEFPRFDITNYEEDYISIFCALPVYGSKRTAAHEVYGNTFGWYDR